MAEIASEGSPKRLPFGLGATPDAGAGAGQPSLRLSAKKAQKGLVIQNKAAEIKLLAERQAGTWLKKSVEAGEREGRGGDRKSKGHDDPLIFKHTLKDLGILNTQSSRWQAAASLPERDFRRHVAEVKT